MKIAVATGKGGIEDRVSEVFARAQTFTIVEVEGKEIRNFKVIQNPAREAAKGAAIRALERLKEEGPQLVIAGKFGPNASQLLEAEGVRMVRASGTVREVLRDLMEKGEL